MPRPRVPAAGEGPLLMGIVNVTPDSFSDGGVAYGTERAVAHALGLVDEGADWLDVGGESTRPGAPEVPAEVEAARVIPVIAALRAARPQLVLSVDTCKASVAEAAVRAGADVVNDVTALADPQMARVIAAAGAHVILMHMRGTPRTMTTLTAYEDLVGEVAAHLQERAAVAVAAGVPADAVWVDPGVGFAKVWSDNPSLIAAVPRFGALGYPVVVGASRKRFIGELTGVSRAGDRVYGSIGAALAAAEAGAAVLRVHDVGPTRQALTVFRACRRGR